MRVGKTSRIGLQAVLITTLFGSATIASAQFPEVVHRAGRLYGVGWGDGYHACSCSGLRLLADLPPRSYASRYGTRHHPAQCLVHRAGSTFYDRFDAVNGRCCDDIGGCDAPHCDAVPVCDSCQITAVDPSEGAGTRQRDSSVEPDRPFFAPRPARLDAPNKDVSQFQVPQTAAPQLESQRPATPVKTHLSDLDSETLTKIVSEPITRKYPIRPEPPASFTPRSITPVGPSRLRVTNDASMGYGLSPSVPIDPVSNQPLRPTFVASPTPGLIQPVHPYDPERTRKPEFGLPSGTSSPLAAGFAGESGLSDGRSAINPHSDRQRINRPVIAAPQPEVANPETYEQSPMFVLRPKRLGGAGPVETNPLADQSRVELAKRGAQSDDQVVRQPDGTTVKQR